jgi:hypothetical protein
MAPHTFRMLTKKKPNRYGQEFHGQMAIQTAVLVAFTQLIPEHQVQVMGVLKARVKVRQNYQ